MLWGSAKIVLCLLLAGVIWQHAIPYIVSP